MLSRFFTNGYIRLNHSFLSIHAPICTVTNTFSAFISNVKHFSSSSFQSGLYIVAVPIGNPDDITLRALNVLRSTSLIAAEDTRVTNRLLNTHNIKAARIIRLDEYSLLRNASKVLAELKENRIVVFMSDAGTPGISDPGQRLVALALAQGYKVYPIPGPSAVTTIASISGFADVGSSGYVFTGFIPRKGNARNVWMQSLLTETRAIIAYEGPSRIQKTLEDIASILLASPQEKLQTQHRSSNEDRSVETITPHEEDQNFSEIPSINTFERQNHTHSISRAIIVARELTKQHEEIFRGTPAGAVKWAKTAVLKGEFTLMLGPIV